MSATFILALCCCDNFVIEPDGSFSLVDHGQGVYLTQESMNPPPDDPYDPLTDSDWSAVFDETWTDFLNDPDDMTDTSGDVAYSYGANGPVYDLGHEFVVGNLDGLGIEYYFTTDAAVLGYDPDTEQLADITLTVNYTLSATTWNSIEVVCRSDIDTLAPSNRTHEARTAGAQKDSWTINGAGSREISLAESDLDTDTDGATYFAFIPSSTKPSYPGSTGSPASPTGAGAVVTITSVTLSYSIEAKP